METINQSGLRIAVIAHGLRAAGGISVATNIIRSLIAIRPNYTYLIFAPESDDYCSLPKSPQVELQYFRHQSYFQRLYFDEITIPRRIRAFKPDVILSLGNIPVRGSNALQALLIQNAHLVYPHVRIPRQPFIVDLAVLMQRSLLKRRLGLVDLVFCQTEVMHRRFRETHAYHGDVLLLPNAVSTEILAGTHETISTPLTVPKDSFKLLILTRYYAHKNLEAIVDCFDRFRDDLRNVVAILTVEEAQHPNVEKMLADIRLKGLDKQIVNIGPVPQQFLADYYRQVDALLLPTLLESCSATYLEAMTFRTPILTSDRDFARGACGNAALYFDPLSSDSIRDSILKLKTDDALRKRLIQEGDRQLISLSGTWEAIMANALSEIEIRLAARAKP